MASTGVQRMLRTKQVVSTLYHYSETQEADTLLLVVHERVPTIAFVRSAEAASAAEFRLSPNTRAHIIGARMLHISDGQGAHDSAWKRRLL